MKVDDRYMARVYLQQARATRWPQWRAQLLAWARRCRVAGRAGQQLDLFSGSAPRV